MADPSATRTRVFRDALEATIRIGLVLLLLVWCFQIVRPFLTPIVWGFIIAIAVAPAYRRASAALGNRPKVTAAIFVLFALAVFIAPVVNVSGALVSSLHDLADQFRRGELQIPPPPESIASWPLIGAKLSAFWSLCASNLAMALESLTPQLKLVGTWLLAAAANVGLGILQFVFSLIIAGIVLVNGERSQAGLEQLMRRLAGESGHHFVELSESTVRSVATGIVGVALIQATLLGVGFVAVGIPGAGFWALLALFLCIIQIGPALVLLPAIIYVFSTDTTLTAIAFLVFALFVALIDNVLKPLLLGRGVDAPMLIIFIGAIGGFLYMGIIGLFVGSVVFVLFHTLVRSWLAEVPAETATAAGSGSGPQRPAA
ncbi:MAG TPA: AI-2E family transporter [Myxococcota bacterium]|nr:AI-2E family transporter [Myxococcota bacterium]